MISLNNIDSGYLYILRFDKSIDIINYIKLNNGKSHINLKILLILPIVFILFSVSITSTLPNAYSLEWSDSQMKIVYPSTWKAVSPSGEWTVEISPIDAINSVHAFFKIVDGDFANLVNSDRDEVVMGHPRGWHNFNYDVLKNEPGWYTFRYSYTINGIDKFAYKTYQDIGDNRVFIKLYLTPALSYDKYSKDFMSFDTKYYVTTSQTQTESSVKNNPCNADWRAFEACSKTEADIARIKYCTAKLTIGNIGSENRQKSWDEYCQMYD